MDSASLVIHFTSQNCRMNVIVLTILLQKLKQVLFDHSFALDGIYCPLPILVSTSFFLLLMLFGSLVLIENPFKF
ncbi:hypothetical protein EUGRSUZ_I00840 [Eucalyptus grandis]|uniref:Uncharacterized protein n=2 Tax=Eucalyptus grandis TaxID=71139 RepID=A0ACC3JD78_EUCGR|nr:hypothetical protein EUGRSUZ_I00840 [Eucalyptus grandis]